MRTLAHTCARLFGLNLDFLLDPQTALQRGEAVCMLPPGKVTRRHMVMAVPAAGAVATAPGGFTTTRISPVMALFEEWKDAFESALGVPEEECDRLTRRMNEIENEMLETPAESGSDLLAKLAAFTNWGVFYAPDDDSVFWAEVREFLEGPASA